MQKPETLECLRDDEPEARNKQTWLLCWYLKVIEGRNDAQVINYLNHWIHSKNNGLSGISTRIPQPSTPKISGLSGTLIL